MEDGSFNLNTMISIFLLIMLNGFFVAAEFSIVTVRRTRIEQLIQEKRKFAKQAKKVIDDRDTHLAATQFGITIVSLGIGWIGEPLFTQILEQYAFGYILPKFLVHTLAVIIGFLLITLIHITLGEQVPKIFSIEKAEKVCLLISGPLHWFCKIAYPGIWLIKVLTNVALKPVGIKANSMHEAHSEEEIKMIVTNSDEFDEDEQEMLKSVFEFDERMVREIMIHRKEMICLYLSDSMEENMQIIRSSKHSKFPVCREDKDDIIGYILLRDIFNYEGELKNIESLIREIPTIPESVSFKKALEKMQRTKHQMLIVKDEYGGVSGLITMEDIVEEIVGDIQDVYDEEENEPIQETEEGVIVDASLLISEINEEFGILIEEIDGIDTIGGYVMTKIEEEQKIGSKVIIANYEVEITEMEDKDTRIRTLRFNQITQQLQVEENE